MRIIMLPAIVINIIAAILLTIGLVYDFKNPKSKAVFGYVFVGSLILYIIALCAAIIYKLIIKPDLYCLILFLCVISPFVIGKLVRYETLKKYTIIQIAFYIVSLITLFL